MALSVAEWEADLRSLGFGASLRGPPQRQRRRNTRRNLRSLGFGASLREAELNHTHQSEQSPKSRLRSFIEGYSPFERNERMLSDLRSLGFGASLRVAIGDATQDTIRSPKSRLRSFIEGRQAAATDIHLRISEVSASELH